MQKRNPLSPMVKKSDFDRQPFWKIRKNKNLTAKHFSMYVAIKVATY